MTDKVRAGSNGQDVEVLCKVQDQEYLGNVTLESGREGLRCRFAWSTNVAEFPANQRENKDVQCRCSPEVNGPHSFFSFFTPKKNLAFIANSFRA